MSAALLTVGIIFDPANVARCSRIAIRGRRGRLPPATVEQAFSLKSLPPILSCTPGGVPPPLRCARNTLGRVHSLLKSSGTP